MELVFYGILFIFGTLFWSFSSVIIHRLKSWEAWILSGRSHCGNCKKNLWIQDLIPILSWCFYKAKCRQCQSKIPMIYPILEISTGLLFSMIGFFLLDPQLIFKGDMIEIIKLFFWLGIWFISIIYIFYDILFLEIHEWVMLSGVILALFWLVWQSFWLPLFSHIPIIEVGSTGLNLILWSIILSTLSIYALYIIMTKELHELVDIIIISCIIISLYLFKVLYNINLKDLTMLNALIWALWIFLFFFIQIIISKWKAMGWWDLRIAIMIGLLLWTSLSFAWTMITYIIWSLIGIMIIIKSKILKGEKWYATQVPFGPFLAIGFFITIFFHTQILQFINTYFYL